MNLFAFNSKQTTQDIEQVLNYNKDNLIKKNNQLQQLVSLKQNLIKQRIL